MTDLSYSKKSYKEIMEIADNAIAIQPIGSVEQHGEHLPVGTDCFIPLAILQSLEPLLIEKKVPAVILPIIPYGKSNEHHSYKGTISLTAKTLIDVLTDVGDSCARAGFKKLVFLNGHGGNHEILDFMTREIRIKTGMDTFVLHPFLKIAPKSLKLNEKESKFGIHAGQLETSLILSIDSSLVRKDKLKASYPDVLMDKKYIDFSERVPFGWVTEDVSTLGVIGDPTASTKEEGEILLRDITDELLEILQEISQFPILKDKENDRT